MSAPAINYHGVELPAYACKVCGALDTDRERLAVHEGRHAMMRTILVVKNKNQLKDRARCAMCTRYAHAHGLCRRHLAREWNRTRGRL